MARKLILLGVVCIALAAIAWWFARDQTSPTDLGNAAIDARKPEPPAHDASGTEHPAAPAETRTSSDAIPSAPAKPESPVPAFLVRGKVVDSRRFVAGGVDVRLVRADGTTSSARSNELGQFEIPVAERPESFESVAIWATRGEEAAVKSVQLQGSKPVTYSGFLMNRPSLGDVDAGTLGLRAARSLQVSVIDSGQPAANIDVRIWRGVETTILWRGKSDASGKLTTPPMPDGCTNVEARREGADGRVRAFLPDEASVLVELAAHFAAAITLVDKQTGSPLPGAEVQLDEYAESPSSQDDSRGLGFGEYSAIRPVAGGKQSTDDAGTARFQGLSSGARYYMRIEAAGYASYPSQGSSGERISSAKHDVRLELERIASRTVHWPIEAGEVPIPPEGARIAIRPAPGSARGRYGVPEEPKREGVVQGGQIVVEDLAGNAQFQGTAPDGSIARLFVADKADTGLAVKFRKPRTIEVSVHDSSGAPVADATTQARNQGNNSLGEIARSDVEGVARLTNLYGDKTEVFVLGPGAKDHEVHAGTVDLAQGDGRVEAVLTDTEMQTMRARLEVRIDGQPQLPTDYRLTVASVLEEKPESGELLLSAVLPAKGDSLSVSMMSIGFLPATVKLSIVRDGSEPRAVMNLVRSATLTVTVAMPRTKDWVAIKIESWNESKQAWGGVSPYFNGLHTPNGPGGSFQFYQLVPGRYQVVDDNSKVASEIVDIAEGQLDARLALDLDGLEWVSGRVELPDPAEISRVRVLCTSAGSAVSPEAAWRPGSKPPEGTYVDKSGTFRVRVKRGVPTHIRAWHPWLAPANPGGELDVDAGREGVVLKLIEGDEVRIAVPQLAESPQFKAARVALYDGAVKGEPRAWLHAPLVDGMLRFTDVPRGRATLWIDPGREFAPFVFEGVAITEGVTDLGVAKFTRGSSLRIKLKVKEGEAAPRIYVFARRELAPMLNRELNSSGETEVVLSGLEAGNYAVSYDVIMASYAPTKSQIEFDGVNDVVIEQ